MVKTIEYVKNFLEAPNLSDMYSQKFIDGAHGDEKVLYELFIQKLNERRTRQAICEVG